jgi:hypothetical protein
MLDGACDMLSLRVGVLDKTPHGNAEDPAIQQ